MPTPEETIQQQAAQIEALKAELEATKHQLLTRISNFILGDSWETTVAGYGIAVITMISPIIQSGRWPKPLEVVGALFAAALGRKATSESKGKA